MQLQSIIQRMDMDNTAFDNFLMSTMGQANKKYAKQCLGERYVTLLERNFELLSSSRFSYLRSAFENLPYLWLCILAQKHVFDALCRIDVMLKERSDQETIAIYPQPTENVFAALKYFESPENVKCVIICQDPYPNEHATGLCLSSTKMKPSLRNFFSAIYAYHGFDYSKSTSKPISGDLTYLAKQGILLLNCALTVEDDEPGSHMKEWKTVTDAILAAVNEESPYCAFLGWGEWATKACFMLPRYDKHLYLECELHPRAWSKKHVVTVAEKLEAINKHLEEHTSVEEKADQNAEFH